MSFAGSKLNFPSQTASDPELRLDKARGIPARIGSLRRLAGEYYLDETTLPEWENRMSGTYRRRRHLPSRFKVESEA
jgi:hypothetical protein